MKSLFKFFIIFCILVIFSIECIYSAKEEPPQKVKYIEGLLNETLKEQVQRILSLMEKYYKEKDYEKVIQTYKLLPYFLPLSTKYYLIIAKSYLNIGKPKEAIKFANKIISLRLMTETYCQAKIIKIQSLIILGKTKSAIKEIQRLKKTFCRSAFADDIKVIKYFLSKSFKLLRNVPENKIKNVLGELYKAKIYYLLNQGKIDEALKNAFYFISLYIDDYRNGGKLIFKIAEAYLKNGQINKARPLYQLILTEWEVGKEALFSKFRLYQLSYNRIKIKELVPEKMIQDLFFYIKVLKQKYPEEEITREAHIFEINLLLNRKDWKRLKQSSLEFFLKYPKDPFAQKAKTFYCNSNMKVLTNLYKKKNIKKIFDIINEEANFLDQVKCSNVYFFLGKLTFEYNLLEASSYYFIKSYETAPPQNLLPNLYLYLALLAEEKGEKKIFSELFSIINRKYSSYFSNNPFFFYLKALFTIENGKQTADLWLEKVINSNLDNYYKEKILRTFRKWALKRKEFEKALKYTLYKEFNPSPEDFILLLTSTFSEDPETFKKIYDIASKLYPNNYKIKWIAAYFFENQGDFKMANKLWQEISKSENLEGMISRSREKLKTLIKQTQVLAL